MHSYAFPPSQRGCAELSEISELCVEMQSSKVAISKQMNVMWRFRGCPDIMTKEMRACKSYAACSLHSRVLQVHELVLVFIHRLDQSRKHSIIRPT